jgi:hypothetical protein
MAEPAIQLSASPPTRAIAPQRSTILQVGGMK